MSEKKYSQSKLPNFADSSEFVPTKEAARILNVTQATLRRWASQENPPVRPSRIRSRLAWPLAEIQALKMASAEDPRQMSLFSNCDPDNANGESQC